MALQVRRPIALVGVVLCVVAASLAACTSDGAGTEQPVGSVGSVAEPTTAPTPAPTASTASTLGAVTDEPLIEVLTTPGPRLHDRWSQLGTFGYGVRPAGPTQTVHPAVPAIAADEPTVEVRALAVNWGIDSYGTLVIADGPAEAVRRVEVEAADLVASTSVSGSTSGDTWLAAFVAGHGGPPEVRRLLAAIDAVMEPDGVCDSTPAACPVGASAGFPPPPPLLVTNATDGASPDVPFDVVNLGPDASSVFSDGYQLLWSNGGLMVTTFEPAARERTDYTTADGEFGLAVGATQVLVDPGADGQGGMVRAPRCCPDGADLGPVPEWSIPEAWAVDGVSFTGSFGFDDYALVFTGTLLASGTPQPFVVAVPVDEQFLARADAGFDLGRAMATAEPIELANRWTSPQGHNGQLAVVEERDDGWYLVVDALGAPRDLLRSRTPIVSYAIDRGAVNVAVAVGDESHHSVVWAHRDAISNVEIRATSVAWHGSYRVESWGED
ncbi:MAG: hypothetical protein AAF467_23740 [Actinomycetota bacterium]